MTCEDSFTDLLSRLAASHERELQSVKDEGAESIASLRRAHSSKIDDLAAEIDSLRGRLGEKIQCDPLGQDPELTVVSIDDHAKDIPDESMIVETGIMVAQSQSSLKISKQCQDSMIVETHVTHNLKAHWSRDKIWGKDNVTLARGSVGTARLHLMPSLMNVLKVTGFFGCDGGVLFPHSTFRTLWDLVALLLIICDILILPFMLAFEPETNTLLKGIENFSLVFWTTDMLQGPFLGYFRRGTYINDRHKIVKHYMKTWFAVDILVVFPEWLVLILSDSEDNPINAVSGFAKLLKSVRVVRILRLLRLAKLERSMELLYDMSKDEFSFVMLEVFQLVSFVLVLNHIIACSWYYVANSARKAGERNWLFLIITEGDPEPDLLFKYVTSLHWSLTQFTPASMRVSARNTRETVFSIIVLFFALVVFSSFVGSITNHINRLRGMRINAARELWSLRRFLKAHAITEQLNKRICKYVEHKLKLQARDTCLHERDVSSKLSPALSDELAFEIHSKAVCRHPFFSRLTDESKVVMHRVCRHVLQLHMAAKDEVVFSPGDEGKYMYVLQSGELEYNCIGHHIVFLSVNGTFEDVDTVRWVGEPVLWVAWRHRGSLTVGPHVPSELLFLDPFQFFTVMSNHPRSWLYAVVYGERFVELLNSLAKLSDVINDDDFHVEASSYANAVSTEDAKDPETTDL